MPKQYRDGLYLCLGLLVMLGVTLAAWATAPSQNLAYWQRVIQQHQQHQQAVGQQRQQLERLEAAASDRLESLETNVDTTTQQLMAASDRLQAAEKLLKDLKEQQQTLSQRYEASVAVISDRLRRLQRYREIPQWAMVFEAETLNDWFEQQGRLRQVYERDRQHLAALVRDRERLQQQERQIQMQQRFIQALRQQLQQQQAIYEREAANQRQLIARLRSDRQALASIEAQLARDSAAIQQLINQRLGYVPRGAPPLPRSGRLAYPIQAPLTSPFGWRIHPILGTQRFHAGVDFGADFGTLIFAAEAGTVIFAGWSGGYGQTVILDHGGGMTTLYAHAQRLLVREGEFVRQGQPIAEVGSTGLSTGPHLHFEVRLNGEPSDPLAYL
ncbi:MULTISPECIES: M23 family metallopeptidase [unclassified Thermosynechococcus]|uniref:M23 family metallopeptidase n=1 Tax=unclassified Thermosynechococcus TaxID=2622553 RepID=UPI0026724F06|nr:MULTISPECIES: M23 family metallopeptidase [unclassified Thermosynechococcus]WKT82856.1 peptidoglycan DD-metalloendopeptidase family protein [Thermosynechococcus sp. HY596]WNC61983.1 peptidoglycan DD-metalloendopeptidase family protein [Thermosynechococcus sp. HY591]WNC64536.1 peptidoglycan DD-metalloendopeptidase family protein [Thermosynechococcus sp. HY593]